MAPQFVDFNADGHLDIFTATFDGSPHVAFGSPEGFQPPQRILDAAGERVLLTQFWNYETTEWDDTDRTIADNADGQLHCISSVAFDWDDDGDFDLLLGDKNKGRLFRQMNEGSNVEPAFTGQNLPVLTDGRAFELDGGMTAPCLVDWDADGRMDLVCGSFGDAWGDSPGGGIYWYRNIGKVGAPEFAAPVTLIPASPRGAITPTRPDAGLYVDVVDYDEDGALDLVVGGYSMWTPQSRPLTDEEQERVTELDRQQQELRSEMSRVRQTIVEQVAELPEEERNDRLRELYSDGKYRELSQKYLEVSRAITELIPTNKREAFVWLYRRQTENLAAAR